jgi:hypothetical protein
MMAPTNVTEGCAFMPPQAPLRKTDEEVGGGLDALESGLSYKTAKPDASEWGILQSWRAVVRVGSGVQSEEGQIRRVSPAGYRHQNYRKR